MIIEIHTNPCRYAFKSKKHSIEDMINVSSVIHAYLSEGGDPRKIHHACPDLKLISSSLGVSTKITHDSKEVQRTTIPVTITKESDDVEV